MPPAHRRHCAAGCRLRQPSEGRVRPQPGQSCRRRDTGSRMLCLRATTTALGGTDGDDDAGEGRHLLWEGCKLGAAGACDHPPRPPARPRRRLHCQSRPPSLSLHAAARRAGAPRTRWGAAAGRHDPARPTRPLLPASRRQLCKPRCLVRSSRRSATYCSRACRHSQLRAPALRPAAVPRPARPCPAVALAEPRRLRLAACRGREGGCGPTATPGLRGPREAAPIALGRAVPSPACRGREGRRAALAPRPATPPHCGTLQCRTPLRPAALARCRISRGPYSTAGCVRHRRGGWEEDKGREQRGDPDHGLISSNLEDFFCKIVSTRTIWTVHAPDPTVGSGR